MSILKKLFGSKNNNFKIELNAEEKSIIERLNKLSEDERMVNIMQVGDSANPKYLNILLYCILNDVSLDVKFSALKRLTKFSEKEKIKAFLLELKQMKSSVKLEPYLSMAMLNLKLITEKEFEQIINGC